MNKKISVAMATYNGEKYIEQQIKSILDQTMQIDELVISDDGSIDKTISLIESIKDKRIKIIKGPQNGVKKNFQNAIENTTGDIIFLADQDDVWEKDKVEEILKVFEKDENITLVVHNAKIVDENLNQISPYTTFKWRNSKNGIVKNIIKNSYVGCCMAFKRKIIKYILPIPNNIEMHDQWIGIINEKKLGKSIFITDTLIKYRRHGKNESSMRHHSLSKMIKNRIVFIYEILRSNNK